MISARLGAARRTGGALGCRRALSTIRELLARTKASARRAPAFATPPPLSPLESSSTTVPHRDSPGEAVSDGGGDGHTHTCPPCSVYIQYMYAVMVGASE